MKLEFEPLERGGGVIFANKVVGGAVPKEFVPGVEKGVKGSLDSGVLAGFPVIDLKIELIDGKYHELDSSALAFEIAAQAATKQGLTKAGPILLEPVMRVDVATQSNYVSSIIGDVKLRRGQVTRQMQRDSREVIEGLVPLANMFGYEGSLKLLAKGQASFSMQFDHYAPVPPIDEPPFPGAVGIRA